MFSSSIDTSTMDVDMVTCSTDEAECASSCCSVATSTQATATAGSNGASSHPMNNNNTNHHSGPVETHWKMEKLEQIARDAARYWSSLPLDSQLDKTFILHALQHSPTLPPKSEFERRFTQQLRFDRDIVLAFCQRDDFETLYQERNLFVPGCLTSDKQVMMAFCRKIPRSLQECSETLCNDPEVVRTALHLDGMELQYASLELREQEDLVRLACQSNGGALDLCPPGPTRQAICSDREFMMHTVFTTPGAGVMWKLAPDSLKNEEDFTVQALKTGLLFRDIPPHFLLRNDFLQRVVYGNARLYLDLDVTLQQKEDLAYQALIATNSNADIHARALLHCPQLAQQSREVVISICQRGDVNLLSDILAERREWADDIQVMKPAIERDPALIWLASSRLQQLPEIIMVSVTPKTAWDVLLRVRPATLTRHPEIVIRIIDQCVSRDLRSLSADIPLELWSDRRICMAWLRRGGRVLMPFALLLQTDREMALTVAQYNWREFRKVGEDLRSNREFALEAVRRNGLVLLHLVPALQQDLEMMVTALANTYGADLNVTIQKAFLHVVNLKTLEREIRAQLDQHNVFVREFLRGISIAPTWDERHRIPPAQRCYLPMLNRGHETSQALKQLIAEYAGVPAATQLPVLRKAQDNLKFWWDSNEIDHDTGNDHSFLMAAADYPEEVPQQQVAFRHPLYRRHGDRERHPHPILGAAPNERNLHPPRDILNVNDVETDRRTIRDRIQMFGDDPPNMNGVDLLDNMNHLMLEPHFDLFFDSDSDDVGSGLDD